MRKVTAFALSSALLLSLAGCGDVGAASSDAINEVSITESNVDGTIDEASASDGISIESTKVTAGISGDLNGKPKDDSISFKDKIISIKDDAETILAALGESTPDMSTKSDTEAHYGYESMNLTLDTFVLDGVECPLEIMIENPEYKTSRNVGVGNTKDEIVAAYGEPGETIDNDVVSALTYNFDGYDITFRFTGDQTTEIGAVLYVNKSTYDQIKFS